MPAAIVHLAVRGVLRIEETEGKKNKKRPQLRLLDAQRIPDPLDGQMRDTLFSGSAPGETVTIPQHDEKFAQRMTALQTSAASEATERNLMTRERSDTARIFFWVTLGLVAVAMILALVGLLSGREVGFVAIIVSLVLGTVTTVIAAVCAARHRVHTRAGAEAHEYLEGVREFIRVAEADRLRMLQSAHGAERYREGSAEIVHLYERLLPYAMLFGEEKTWGRVLEVAYDTSRSQPNWIAGYTAMHFSSQLSSFSSNTQASSTYTTASSSGGSTGGGFSGGGGGGGFSGGR
nr:DUF2207 domain-containing protein [Microbacterium sp. NIBRBAC000506063]